MPIEDLIPASDFCAYHHLEINFVHLLEQQGLIETVTVEQSVYLQPGQLGQLEKFVRLHQDLAVHPSDLDIVADLLDRLEGLQKQVTQLQNRLVFYESISESRGERL